MQNAVGMGLSLVYVLAVLAASSLLARRGMGEEATRKFVHIALGGWWLVAPGSSVASVGGGAACCVHRCERVCAGAGRSSPSWRAASGEDTPGTVYYAVSLTALALFSFGLGASYVGALGVFCMAFGDGFAAVLGRRFGRRVLVGAGDGKSLVGSADHAGGELRFVRSRAVGGRRGGR